MSKRSFNGLFKCLGAVSVALIAAGCSSAVSESAEQTTSQAEELGESFNSCVAANSTSDWVTSSGTLSIDASANTTGTIIVSPGNGVVKVNGRTCKTAAGATIALSAVKVLNVKGKAGSSDTFVLDFSTGLPKAPMLQAGGIVVDGNETVASTTTPDTVVLKGSTGVDPVSVGLDATTTDAQIDVALTATNKLAHVQLKKLGRSVQGPYQPSLIFSLGTGDDTFTGMGFGTATPMTYGMSIYGGAGNDTIIGGAGSDKIIGGGQATDTLDYSARTTDTYADMDSSKVGVWGGDLRGVTMGTETISIDIGAGASTVTFASEATPAAIVAKINGTFSGLASVVGNRLRLTATGSATKIIIDGGSSLGAAKLGLSAGLYESVGNDGKAGGQMALPWTAPSAWTHDGVYKVGDVMIPTVATGFWYRVSVAGTASATGAEPTWDTTVGGTTTDNTVTWVTGGKLQKASTVFSYGDVIYDVAHDALYKLTGAMGSGSAATITIPASGTVTDGSVTFTTVAARANTTAYVLGDIIPVGTAGQYYKATVAGTSGASAPSFAASPAVGDTIVDGTVTWTYQGVGAARVAAKVYAVGDFIYDLTANRLAKATAVSSTNTSAASIPTYPTTPATFADGDILWVYVGGMAEADDVQGIAVLSTGTGNDVLVGNTLANTLNGNDGNDVLSGGPILTVSSACPTDKLNGGAGHDWFDMGADDAIAMLTKTDCNQTITGGVGQDVVDYSQRSATSKILLKLDGTTLSGEQGTVPKEGDKVGNDVEIVLGGKGDDTLTGTDNADFLFGGDGKDTIYGGKGDDHIYGGPNDDAMYGDVGNDTFYELAAYPAATAWNEPLLGGTFAGVGLAVYGADKPGAGNDVAFGGADLTETNKLDFTDSSAAVKVALCSDAAATNTAFGNCTSAKSDYVGLSTDGTAGGTTNTYVNIEYVAGSLTAANTMIGTANAEVFEGGAGVDILLGQGGQDTLFGYPDPATGGVVDNASADVLCGGDDDDVIQGGTATVTEGEGQMDQTKGAASAQVLLSATTGAQFAGSCKNWASTTNPNTVIQGVNLCFGTTSSNKQHCAN